MVIRLTSVDKVRIRLTDQKSELVGYLEFDIIQYTNLGSQHYSTLEGA